MFSPFEELELLAEHLPDEGESVVLTRRDGELICEPRGRDEMLDGVEDAHLYGLLVQINERLNSQGTTPLWASVMAFMVASLSLHAWLGPWRVWYIVPVLGLLVMYGSFLWIKRRQRQAFVLVHLPCIAAELRKRSLSPFALIAGVRQHSELNTLLDELVRWTPDVRMSGSR